MKKKRKQKPDPDIDQNLDLGDCILGLIENSRYDPAEQAELADKRSQIALDVLEALRQLEEGSGWASSFTKA
jgi:hypothetical protein